MWSSILAITLGASCGALLRWLLGLWLNPLYPSFPPGTLAANLLGGYLVGLAVATFAAHPELPAEWRLFAVTGFLGGLTTFSAFSAETVILLQQGRALAAGAAIAANVLGSLLLTLLGFATFTALRS